MDSISPEVYTSMGLSGEEFQRIVSLLGRDPSMTELGMFSVMWSEHCGYKYSRPILKLFARYKESIEGGGLENAGIVPIGDGLGVTMKVESHNHPSAVEPYQGAATGVGGIIRDILTMGARPIASLNSLRFGPVRDGEDDPESVSRNRYLAKRVVAGIGGYGNCVGVPTVAGEIAFHKRYSGNPLVNAMCVGILRLDAVATAAASGIGNSVMYLGSATGKDGIHGATFASESLGDDSDERRPNVQIGDPFAEKSLIEATLEALDTGAIAAIQDMGAAGLTCSTVEMASKGGVGMTIDLDKVPVRERGMTALELMLSESQERMLAVVRAGREKEVADIFHKWELLAETIGQVTEGCRVRVVYQGQVVADLDPRLLTDQCPTYSTPIEVPDYHLSAAEFDPGALKHPNLDEALLKLISSPNCGSKRWAFEQYDQQVQTQTVVLPGDADAAALSPRGTKKGIAVKIDGNGLQVYFDPFVGGQLAVCEAARNVACVGAMPVAVTDGLNFGNPERPHVYWQFARAVEGIAEACEALNTPVVSGNVSFYNESERGEVLPTPVIGMLGILENAQSAIRMIPRSDSGIVALVRVPSVQVRHGGLGASAYLSEVLGIEDGLPTAPSLAGEKALCRLLVEAVRLGLADWAHDVSEGGLALAAAEVSVVGTCGLSLDLAGAGVEAFSFASNDAEALFGEVPGWVLVGARSLADASELSRLAERHGIDCDFVGSFDRSDASLHLNAPFGGLLEIEVGSLASAYDAVAGQMLGA